MARLSVYVDGYNLYHRRLEGTIYKWLNLRALAGVLVPGESIGRVRYFTTWAQPRPGGDGKEQQRQQAYIRALRTTPNFSVPAFGLFRERKKKMQTVFPPPDSVWVYRTEEKGSDVNLASYLLLDAFRNEYDMALVISNDADLKAPINIVRHEFDKTVVVAIPGTIMAISTSALPADRYIRIDKTHLKACQFPATLQDAYGTVTKPAGW